MNKIIYKKPRIKYLMIQDALMGDASIPSGKDPDNPGGAQSKSSDFLDTSSDSHSIWDDTNK